MRSRWGKALLFGLALGMAAGSAPARPRVCVDTCSGFLCNTCSMFCSSIECYIGCMNAFPGC
jgi:hypothetical protein